MTNETVITCPHCGHKKADTLAIIGRSVRTKDPKDETKSIGVMKKTILYRCLRCKNQFEKSPKEHVAYQEFFKPEQVKDAMENA